MQITLKLMFVVLAVTMLVLSIDGYLRVQRDVEVFQADMVRDTHMFGQILGSMLADTRQTYGQQRVLQLLADANATKSQWRFRWLPLESTAIGLEHTPLDQQQLAALWRGEWVAVTAPDPQGQATLYTYVPVKVGSETPGAIEVSESLIVVQRYVHNTILRTFRVWLALVVLSGCLLLLVGIAMIGRPIRRLIEKTRRVGAGDLEGPLCFRRHDEFAEVAAALNHMCEQLKTSQAVVRAEMEARMHTLEQLRHMDRLKTVGSLASGIAHELGTPLNVVSGRASLIASGRLGLSEVADSARNIQAQVQRMTLIIRQLLDFARRKSPTRVAIDLRTLARHTLDLLMPLAAQQHAVLTLQTDDAPVFAHVDTGQMQQVLMNLVTNAWQAMPHGGEIAIGVHRTATPPPQGHAQSGADYGCISVTDQGKGIPAVDLEHIFEPFFTTKEAGQGTGLGLSIAYGIVHDHGGWIDVHSWPGEGTCFAVYVPMEDEPCRDAS